MRRRRRDTGHCQHAGPGRDAGVDDRRAEAELAAFLLLGGAGLYDPIAAMTFEGFEERIIAGRTVHVGTTEMLDQDEHQRGLPYLYETDEYLFVVTTDDVAWATEALAALP